MSNKHINHQHGLTSMNATRPKSKMWKRRNKATAKARKEALMKALHEAISAKKGSPVKKVKAVKVAKAGKTTSKKEVQA